jgi:hypothetical protein
MIDDKMMDRRQADGEKADADFKEPLRLRVGSIHVVRLGEGGSFSKGATVAGAALVLTDSGGEECEYGGREGRWARGGKKRGTVVEVEGRGGEEKGEGRGPEWQFS